MGGMVAGYSPRFGFDSLPVSLPVGPVALPSFQLIACFLHIRLLGIYIITT